MTNHKLPFDDLQQSKIYEHTRRCSKCKQDLPLMEFSKLGGATYSRPECKKCMNVYRKNMKKLHDKYDSQRPREGDSYCCPICNRKGSEIPHGEHGPAGKNKWCLDHNHITVEFRGWLCQHCNLLIGKLEKAGGVDAAVRAIQYLNGESETHRTPKASIGIEEYLIL